MRLTRRTGRQGALACDNPEPWTGSGQSSDNTGPVPRQGHPTVRPGERVAPGSSRLSRRPRRRVASYQNTVQSRPPNYLTEFRNMQIRSRI
ncbi:hypothetical protein NDU88_003241 [Pleurodeles waltl]|uniref:Uncharacterized protein n=1 Tax=Pleurodeles waltl TaxID=8319 RepID=A0AAV7TNF8_PLEWA|nr:hypothetical protein NDU88_003241 [Pleurodeles waltl]